MSIMSDVIKKLNFILFYKSEDVVVLPIVETKSLISSIVIKLRTYSLRNRKF